MAELPSNKEVRWVAMEDFANYPFATPQKKMLAEYLKNK